MGAEMLERHYMQSVMRQLPEIAKHLEQIADNTKQHDFSAWNGDYSSFKERYPEVFVTEDMFAFLSVLFRSFQENGVEGVCSTIATHTHRHDVEMHLIKIVVKSLGVSMTLNLTQSIWRAIDMMESRHMIVPSLHTH